MSRQNLIERYLVLAAELDATSPEVAKALRQATTGGKIQRTWLVRWNSKHQRESRKVGHSLVLFTPYYTGGLPGVIHEQAHLSEVFVRKVRALNWEEVQASERAQELGLKVPAVPARYPTSLSKNIATLESTEQACSMAQPKWVDDSRKGYMVIGHEPGENEDGRSIEVPVYGTQIERGPGFGLEKVPSDWLGTYSEVTTCSFDGSRLFSASMSSSGGGPINLEAVSQEAEWRIPREKIAILVNLMEEATKLQDEEEAARQLAAEEAERQKLAKRFKL